MEHPTLPFFHVLFTILYRYLYLDLPGILTSILFCLSTFKDHDSIIGRPSHNELDHLKMYIPPNDGLHYVNTYAVVGPVLLFWLRGHNIFFCPNNDFLNQPKTIAGKAGILLKLSGIT